MGQLFNRPGSNLATIARETGYPVREVPGWSSHHHGALANHVAAIVCHHTAGPEPQRSASNYPSLNVVRNGRAGLPGPLSNYGIGYDGTIYVISAGTCWHAGRGGWNGCTANSQAIGIEAEDGGDGDWTDAQRDVYPRLCAVICQFLGVDAGATCGHKEWCSPPGRKIDPAGIDMHAFRTQVGHYLHNPHEIHRGAAAAGPEPGGIESMALNTAWKDSYGNTQTVEGFMSETQRDINDIKAALLTPQPSRVPGAEHIQVPLTDAVRDTNGVVYTLPGMITAAGGTDTAALAEALRPALVELVGPVVQSAVHDALGADNSDQAAAIVDAIATRLATQGTAEGSGQ